MKRSLPIRLRDGVAGLLGDHPVWIATILTSLTAVHAVLTIWHPWLDPYKALHATDQDSTSMAVTIYLGTAAAAAIIAGFGGVILVFVVGSASPRLRAFRDSAGRPLQRTWTAIIAEPFLSTLLGVVAAITQTTAGRVVAPWLFELAVVLLVHVALRLLWLLRNLVVIVGVEDQEVTAEEHAIPLDEIFGAR